jgi:Ca-activated chloride channel homolog
MHDAATGTKVHQQSNQTQRRMRLHPRRWRSSHTLSTVLVIAAAITAAVVVGAAQRDPRDPTLFRGSVDLVNVGVTVAAKKQRLVTDLTVNDFAVYEDGKPQAIFAFASGVEPGPPLHVGVLLDVSGSQELDLGFTQNAVIKFLTSLPEAVDMTFIDFASQVRGGRYAQSDFPRLVTRVRSLTAGGDTALYDAIGVYLDGASEQDGRKVMVLYTDGGDTQSSLSLGTLMTLLKASDATVYAIGALEKQPQTAQFIQRALLAEIAEATGGTAFFPSSVKELDRIYEQVLGEVRAQYTIGYLSTNEKTDGAWRRVDVKITRADAKGVRIRARKGYYAPLRP